MDRLHRLDDILPKYQKMTGCLYDLLRVKAMEEIVPAVEALVRCSG